MALYPNVNNTYSYLGKTHTNLVVSEGSAPAERFIVAKDNNTRKHGDGELIAEPFIYTFGPEGNQTVVIAKGKLVEAAGTEFDRERGHHYTAVRVADENSTSVIGVNHHNVYEQRRDRMEGNLPTIIRRDYIEVPLFESNDVNVAQQMAKAANYGAAYGLTDGIKAGDRVKVGKNGNFVKLNTEDVLDVDGVTVLAEADSIFTQVGQVLAVNKELPPEGFLQYFVEASNPMLEEMIKAMSHAPTPGKDGYPAGYPYGPESWKADFEKNLIEGSPMGSDKGIPFLTDGFFRAKKVLANVALSDIYDKVTNNDGVIESVTTRGAVTVTGGNIAATGAGAVFIKLRHKIDHTEAGHVVAKIAGEVVGTNDFHIDLHQNMVIIYIDGELASSAVTLDVKAIVDPVAGIPTEWDYAGSVGAVRIQLIG